MSSKAYQKIEAGLLDAIAYARGDHSRCTLWCPARSSEMIQIDLPFPVSTNKIYTRLRSGKVIKSPAYRLWTKEADALFLVQKRKVGSVKGKFDAFIYLDEGRRGRPDADNHVKCVLDALQRWGVIMNDNQCNELHVSWGYAPEGCRVVLYPNGLYAVRVRRSRSVPPDIIA